MPRPKGTFKTPSLTLHKASGQAVVRIDGQDHYCGALGSPEAQRKYDRLIAEWILRGRQPAPDATPATENGPTISQIIAAFWTHARSYHSDCVTPSGAVVGELDNHRLALRPLRRLYGATPAREFGPLKLKAVRAEMLKPREERDEKTGKVRTFPGWCRTHANRQISRIRAVFKWATENELLPASAYHGLLTVKGLRKGKCEARESDPVAPVPDKDVEAVVKLLPPPVAAMVKLQRITGMRPDEVCSMRGVDLDTSGKLWIYSPAAHKTAHHGHKRTIYLGERCQQIIKPYLKSDVQAFLFSPKEAEAWMREERGKRRKTPLSCGNVTGSNRRRSQRRRPRDRYSVDSYRRAIARACERADIPHWHPHQLRHSAATEWRKEYGPDVALVLLGDRTTRMIDVYAEKDASRAREVMAAIG